jgi:hypothetical protein
VFYAEALGKGNVSATPLATPLTIDNRAMASAGRSMPVTVLFFDALNIPKVGDVQFGKRELVKYLRTIQPGDPVALYSLNGPMCKCFTTSLTIRGR